MGSFPLSMAFFSKRPAAPIGQATLELALEARNSTICILAMASGYEIVAHPYAQNSTQFELVQAVVP